ncbi:hypothetical protein D9757_010958 [Collybiopsis confluens]|uniref:CFEM domain-containing protein n=1 Tax=Collybiopsis confluens TaxID=2823264 RepID=A0A8H5GJP8_9AGAR|nr:hypothetical protein D9757_010958 [Collybiopsis confluens]
MKCFAVISALSAITSTWASAVIARQSFPPCSQTCLTTADFGSCNPTDDTCLCNLPAFISSTATCIANSCSGNDLTEADAAAQQLCLAVGVTLTASSITITTGTSPSGSASISAPSATSPVSSTGSSSSGNSSPSGTSSTSPSSTSATSNGALSINAANTLTSLAVVGFVAAIVL